VCKNIFFEKNHVPTGTKVALEKNHALKGKRGLSYFTRSNHVLREKRAPSP